MRLSRQIALITGGASGIGAATAKLFAREGASVVITDLNEAAGHETAKAITDAGGRVLFEGADVTSDADCRRVVAAAQQAFGAIHILFNNAGIIRRATVLDVTEEEWDRVMAVNVKAMFLTSSQSWKSKAVDRSSTWHPAGVSRVARKLPFTAHRRARSSS
jgi:NAD(P)-dependent dehydrogenase (short-subunit alcohol dehydrogenase family)